MLEDNIQQTEFKTFSEQIEDTETEKLLSIPAKRLFEKLEPIPSKFESLQYRWFWELIQNASDFNSEVDIELEQDEEYLIFRHNGQPFKIVDVENLITPDSDKDDSDIDEEYIGRVGCGFISTHALSSLITVEGIVKDKYRDNVHHSFTLDLDRSNFNSKQKLIESIKKSVEQFKNKHKEAIRIPGSFETRVTYNLHRGLANLNPKEIARAGIAYAFKVLPLVFTFLPKLRSVKFIQKEHALTESYFYQKTRSDQTGLCEIGLTVNNMPQNDITVKYAEHDKVMVAVEIKDNLVVEYAEDMAVLYLYLPMVGSEKFPFPVSISSPKFKPETERSGINISEHDTDNRTCLINGVTAYETLLKSLSADCVGNLYNLVVIKNDRIKALPTTSSAWFQQNIEKEIKSVLEKIAFVNCNGKCISYAELRLPFIPENKSEAKDLYYYDTVSDLIINNVPSRAEYPKWLKNIDFTIFKTIPFRLDAAVKIVEDTTSLTRLSLLLNKNEEESTRWLATFIKYVIGNENGLLINHSIIPCKSKDGKFVNRDAEIYVDNGVDADLIEVFNKMKNADYQEILLNDIINKEIKDLLPPAKIKTGETIAKEIDDIFRVRLNENSRLSKQEIEGLGLLLKWLKIKGFPKWSDLPKFFPTFSGSYSNFFMESFDEEEKVKAITIRNSGKQDSLVKIAESDITDSELNTVIQCLTDVKQIVSIIGSGTSIAKLTELSQLFHGDIPDKVMSFAKEEARRKKEFSNLLDVGSKVEQLFIDTLKQYKVDSNKNEIIHAGGGSYDVRIHNTENNKSFYIELKSCHYQNKEPINIAVSQVKRAVKELAKKTFCIIVIERSHNNEMDIEYIKTNTKYFKDPGQYLGEISANYDIIEKSSNTNDVVDLTMANAEFKGSLDYDWILDKIGESGFNELISDINAIIS